MPKGDQMKPVLWKTLATVSPQEIDAALQSWDGLPPGSGLLALVCEQEHGAVAMLQQGARTRDIPLVGAVVPGVIAGGRLQRHGALLLTLSPATQWEILPLPRTGATTNEMALQALADFTDRHAAAAGGDTLLLLIDAMTPDIASLLNRLYLDIGDQVSYAGSSVGSETFQSVPCLFDHEVFVQDAVLALLLHAHPGATMAHHYRGSDDLRVATATVGNRIRTIDGRPAFEVYRELMASEYGIPLEQDNFYRYAVHFPFALNRAQGEPLVRIPVATADDGSVFCSGEVPENALLSIVRAVEAGDLATAHEVGGHVRSLGSTGVLGFYCAGRLMHLGEEAAIAELQALAGILAPAPLFGALSLGEIGCVGQQRYPAFHNATLVAIPWL
jgi:hypothetical protein